MQNDKTGLERLNKDIGDAEARGDSAWLAEVMAPKLAFRRASGELACRADFLEALKKSPPRETEIEAVQLYGNRAVVSCIVTVKSPSGPEKFHNLRLLIRHKEKWRLLGWANEKVT